MKTTLIGKKIKIIESKNGSLANIEGTVIDETKNTLSIETDGRERKIIKDLCVFEIDGKKVKGKEITKSPEERIK